VPSLLALLLVAAVLEPAPGIALPATGRATRQALSPGTHPRTMPARSLGDVVPRSGLRIDRSGRAPGLFSTADTILVFTDSLETLSSPGNEGGWTHVDESFQPTAWNISTLYGCGNHAFWCGIVDSTWTGDPNRRGYANSWDQTLQNFADLSNSTSPYTISFKNRMNVEPNFDFGTVEVLDFDDGWLPIATFTGVVNDSGSGLCNTFTATIPDTTVLKSTPTYFRFHFTSDIEASSQDGLYPQGEGWAIDDVTVKGGSFDVRFFDDMEGGLGTWARSTFPAVGDYWKIAANPPTQEICTTNNGKVWRVNDPTTGALVARLDDKLVSKPIAVNRSDQVFLFFDVYRDLPFDACFYYSVSVRTRNVGAPAWSAWVDPTGLLYYGSELEWLRQTVPLASAAGVDSIQFRVGVKDYGPIYCGGSQTVSGTTVYFDNFRIGVLGAAGPSISVTESDLYNDTFRTTPFFGNDNFNTVHGDSVAVKLAAAHGLKTASLTYSLNNAAFTSAPLVKVGTSSPNAYYADVPAGSYARGTNLRYYFSATDSQNTVITLPTDAVSASHYYQATILPAIQATSGSCPDDTARILYVNSSASADVATGISQSLTSIGARFDRFDINAADQGAGNSPGGGDPSDPTHAWPAVPLGTLGIYRAIVWDVGDRAANTLTAQDQSLLQSWLALTGKNRGLLLAGDNLAFDMVVNQSGIANFLSCAIGSNYLRDTWENAPQDTLTPTLTGTSGTPINLEVFPTDGGCPVVNHFDALATSSCAGANGRAWLTYPNGLAAATERRGALGVAGGDSLRAVLMGLSLNFMPSTTRRNLLLYRTLVNEFEVPSCYAATGVPDQAPPAAQSVRLYPAAPNPFNPSTTIRFSLEHSSRVRLRIFGVDGALVRTLADRALPAGEHRLLWDGKTDLGHDAASGAYFLALEADGARTAGEKLILLR